MKRVLILGGTGMLGHKLVQAFEPHFEVWTTIRGDLEQVKNYGFYVPDRILTGVDVADDRKLKTLLEQVRPDVVINAVGIIKQLDKARNIPLSLAINSLLPHRLADLGQKLGFRLICISTDCVFDGKDGNYSEADTPNALDLYGQSKRWGEVAGSNCLTIRTSIIGRELGTSHSLVDWFLSNRGGTVKGFAGAIYSGFPTIVFADILRNLISEEPELSGLYHVSSEPIDKFSLLKLINSAYEAGIEISREEEFRIDRSLDSSRFRLETGFEPLPWPVMVERMAADPTPYDKWQ